MNTVLCIADAGDSSGVFARRIDANTAPADQPWLDRNLLAGRARANGALRR